MAPRTVHGAAFKKDGGADAWSVMDGKTLDVKYESLRLLQRLFNLHFNSFFQYLIYQILKEKSRGKKEKKQECGIFIFLFNYFSKGKAESGLQKNKSTVCLIFLVSMVFYMKRGREEGHFVIGGVIGGVIGLS